MATATPITPFRLASKKHERAAEKAAIRAEWAPKLTEAIKAGHDSGLTIGAVNIQGYMADVQVNSWKRAFVRTYLALVIDNMLEEAGYKVLKYKKGSAQLVFGWPESKPSLEGACLPSAYLFVGAVSDVAVAKYGPKLVQLMQTRQDNRPLLLKKIGDPHPIYGQPAKTRVFLFLLKEADYTVYYEPSESSGESFIIVQ